MHELLFTYTLHCLLSGACKHLNESWHAKCSKSIPKLGLNVVVVDISALMGESFLTG